MLLTTRMNSAFLIIAIIVRDSNKCPEASADLPDRYALLKLSKPVQHHLKLRSCRSRALIGDNGDEPFAIGSDVDVPRRDCTEREKSYWKCSGNSEIKTGTGCNLDYGEAQCATDEEEFRSVSGPERKKRAVFRDLSLFSSARERLHPNLSPSCFG